MYEVVADQVLGIYGPINGQVHIATRSFGNSRTMSAQIPTATAICTVVEAARREATSLTPTVTAIHSKGTENALYRAPSRE